jgi:lysophospholipase L1-like esterase
VPHPPRPAAFRRHLPALAIAFGIVVALDVVIARVDVFTPLMPREHPTTFFAGINSELMRVVRALYPRPHGPRAVVLLGNSQLVDAGGPPALLEAALAARGVPAGTPVLPLCVLSTYPTDFEVLARRLAPVRPDLVLVGLGAPDLGTTLERARTTPVVQLLDTGFRDGLVGAPDWRYRVDRWLRTTWRLYRYRSLFRDIALPPEGPRIPATTLERVLAPAEFLTIFYGADRTRELLAARADYERTHDPALFARYLETLRGPDYAAGVRSRWRGLEVEPIQAEALRRLVAHVRAAGGRPVWVLIPENPLLESDPEVGAEVHSRSDAVAGRLAAEAAALDVPFLDLRHSLPESAFVDLNHLYFNSGKFVPVLADALARHGLLAPAEATR